MFINAATERSLDLIASRASDVYKAFTPGALPRSGDVETSAPSTRRVLDPLTVAAPANDYFVTTDDRGNRTYTRDGRMRIENAMLVGSNGRPMLGYRGGRDAAEALRIDPVDAALGRPQSIRIEQDGSVAYDRRVIEPRTGSEQMQRVCVGRLALARFPAATRLAAAGDASFAAPAGVIPHLGVPEDANFGALVPHAQEQSRIDIDVSLERLHDAYVAFDALQAAHKAQGATGKVAMDLLK